MDRPLFHVLSLDANFLKSGFRIGRVYASIRNPLFQFKKFSTLELHFEKKWTVHFFETVNEPLFIHSKQWIIHFFGSRKKWITNVALIQKVDNPLFGLAGKWIIHYSLALGSTQCAKSGRSIFRRPEKWIEPLVAWIVRTKSGSSTFCRPKKWIIHFFIVRKSGRSMFWLCHWPENVDSPLFELAAMRQIG